MPAAYSLPQFWSLVAAVVRGERGACEALHDFAEEHGHDAERAVASARTLAHAAQNMGEGGARHWAGLLALWARDGCPGGVPTMSVHWTW
jgi:hypothetical protein